MFNMKFSKFFFFFMKKQLTLHRYTYEFFVKHTKLINARTNNECNKCNKLQQMQQMQQL